LDFLTSLKSTTTFAGDHRSMTLSFKSKLNCLLAIGALFSYFCGDVYSAQPGRTGAPPVAAAPVIKREIAAGQTFVASIGPLKRTVIASAVEGRVVKLLVEEGDRIAAKQPLAQLQTTTIELELRVAEAEQAFRQAEMDELKSGSLLDQLEQSKAKMLGAKANLEFATNAFKRIESLFKSSAVSPGDYDEALSKRDAAEQAYLELKAAHALMVAGNRPERIAQAQARLENQRAIVDLIRDRIEKYTIVSAFDGYVVAKFTDSGAWLGSGDPVVEVLALDEVEVKAYVTEEHVPFVRVGMPVRIEVPSVNKRVFTGTVSAIVPQADTRARTFPVNIRVQNEISADGPVLKSGMFARVELPTGELTSSLMVPKDAIVLGGAEPIVFVIRQTVVDDTEGVSAEAATKVAPVSVELGVASGDWIAIKGKLAEGDLVVVEGNERLRPDQAVSVKSTRSPPKESNP
jgi:HlyD family secretion protein